MAAQQPDSASGLKSSNHDLLVGLLTLAVVVVALAAPLVSGILFHHASTGISSSVVVSSLRSSSAEGPPSLCAPLTPDQNLANSRAANASAGLPRAYDEQMILGFEQNFTSISYNVTVRAQNDTFGFGPAYLLNGLTDSGYWYQVGVAWNLGTPSGGQILHGFRFVYEVWNTAEKVSIFPPSRGTFSTSFSANDQDMVLLSLEMAPQGQVSMTAYDLNTSASARASYDSYGATQFLGFKERVTPYPTSLLTEWYHVVPYYCSSVPVVYSNDGPSLNSAWLRIDEWNLTGAMGSRPFDSGVGGRCCVIDTGTQGVGFDDPSAFQSIGSNGTTIYANAHKFVTP